MLKARLSIPADASGNDITHAVQLVQNIRKSLRTKLGLATHHGLRIESSLL